MKVEELIEELQKFPKKMEVVDYEGVTFKSLHLKTVIDSDYPYQYEDHIAVCLDCDEVAYCDWTIISEIRCFLGEEGLKYFIEKQLNPITGAEMDFNGKYYWEGRQIRNHILEKFPKVVTWLGTYQRFEDEMFEWTKRATINYKDFKDMDEQEYNENFKELRKELIDLNQHIDFSKNVEIKNINMKNGIYIENCDGNLVIN